MSGVEWVTYMMYVFACELSSALTVTTSPDLEKKLGKVEPYSTIVVIVVVSSQLRLTSM